jgi:hypothetical protein
MLEITVHNNNVPSSKRAIAFARHLMDIKKETQKEMRRSFKNDEHIKKIVQDLLDKQSK